jgi:phage terminase small subunit
MNKDLSEQQRILAQGKAKGMTDSDACKAAGYKAKSWQAACNQVARMMKNDEFKVYYDELTKKTEDSTVMSIVQRKEMLTRISDANEDEDPNASRQAIAELNKMDGGYEPEKHEVEFIINIGGDAD